MSTFTQPQYLSDVLLVEVKEGWTKDTVVFGPTEVALAIGTVIGLSNNQTYVQHDPADTSVVGVLASRLEPSTTPQKGVLIRRGAVVAKNNLIWKEVLTDEEKIGALSYLEQMGIVAQNAL